MWKTARSAWMGGARRGSIIIASYFLIAILLGLAIPQTTRSLSSVRLETRYLDRVQLGHGVESGIDQALRYFRNQPNFGDTTNADVPTCTMAGFADWDCMPASAISIPPDLQTLSIRARNDPNDPTWRLQAGKYRRRRYVRVLGSSRHTNDQIIQEAVVEVRRRINGGSITRNSFRVGPDGRYFGSARVYGDGVQAVDINDRAIAYGKILVGYPGQSLPHNEANLCCGNASAVRLGPTAQIRDSADTRTLATQAGGRIPPGHFEHPDWGLDAPPTIESVSPCSGSAGGIEVPVSATWTFCPVGDTDNRCLNGGAFDGRLGTVASDGTIAYCMDFLRMRNGATAQFKGNAEGTVRLIANGFNPGTGLSVHTGPSTTLYSFPQGATPAPPSGTPPEFMVHTAQGNTHGVQLEHATMFYGSLDVPEATITVGTGTATTVDISGTLIGSEINLRDSAVVHVQPGLGGPGAVDYLRIIGWRRCLNDACTQ